MQLFNNQLKQNFGKELFEHACAILDDVQGDWEEDELTMNLEDWAYYNTPHIDGWPVMHDREIDRFIEATVDYIL